MTTPEKKRPALLTLRDAARRLGMPESLLVELVYVHPPIIEVTLLGRAPRLRADQLADLRKRLVDVVMELIRAKPSLLGVALKVTRSPLVGEDAGSLQLAEIRRIIVLETAALRA